MSTTEDIDFHDEGPFVDCWQCAGEGEVGDCFDGFCIEAEGGCDLCLRQCDICHGRGGWAIDPEAGAGDAG